ncbi:MAG: histidinol phosphate aminotransferase apoenzyme [Acidobacteriaceae bacterium]|nr:histidinol phosphate aminotransferase apoenzyme [Acidobacteriaceae bacterium]
MLKAREAVRTLKEYHPPLGNREGLRLDFNENTAGCSRRVLQKLRELDGDSLARYPVREPGERVVAAAFGVSPEELLLTNGTDEAIHLICETYLEPGDDALVVVPTFAMYEIYAAATGARVVSIPAGQDFAFPTADVLSTITSRTRFIAVANPNNPTGAFTSLPDLASIAKVAPHAAFLVDEAYFEFSGETIAPKWRELPNLFVSRTFSKAYGLAGLRIGVLMGNGDQMQVLRRASSPYNLNSVALACLPEALADKDFVSNYVSQALDGRRQLESEVEVWGVRFWPSRANFVLMYLGEHCKEFISAMRARGILVRDRSSDPGCQDCVRITVGIREHNQRLLTSLREVFSEIGLRQKVAR